MNDFSEIEQQFEAHAAGLPLNAYDGSDQASAPRRSSVFFAASDLEGQPIPSRQWLVDGLVPMGTVTLLGGDGGTGKSLVALQLATSTALAQAWLGLPVTSGRALYISAEDDRDELHRRLSDIVAAGGVALADLDSLTVRSLAGEDALLATAEKSGVLHPSPLYHEIDGRMRDEAPALVVLDTLADLFPGNENDRAQARQFIGMLVIQEGYEADPDARVLRTMKANYSRTGGEISLRWEGGVFVAQAPETGLDKMAATAKAERVFLKLLDLFDEQGRRVNSKGGPNFAPKVFSSHPESEGISKRALGQAMEKLLTDGKITVGTEGPPSRRVSFIARGE
jgi:RecA-family ATPase